MSPRFLTFRWVALGLLAICLVGYFNSLHGGFMIDDHIVILGQKGVSNQSWESLAFHYQGLFYRPLSYMYLKLTYNLFGINVVAYHVHNLILFWLVGLMFFVLIKRLCQDERLAFLSAVFFLIHPINSMMVNYITASYLSLLMLVFEGCALLLLAFLENGRKSFYFLSLFLFALALFIHEMTYTFILYLFLVICFIKPKAIKKNILICLPYVVLLGLNILFRLNALAFKRIVGGTPLAIKEPLRYFATIAELLGWYLSKLFVPLDIIFLWTGKFSDSYVGIKTVGFFIVLGVIIFLVFFLWKRSIKSLALGIFAVGFLPMAVSSFAYYPFVGPIIEPHWFYFSSFGFFILIAYAVLKLKEKIPPIIWPVILTALIVGSLVFLYNNNRYWKNERTYCRYWLKINPWNLTPYYGLGKTYFDDNDCPTALYYFHKEIEKLNSINVYLLADAGYCHSLLGDDDLAAVFLNRAFYEDPLYAPSYYYYGLVLLKRGDPDAVLFFKKAAELYPELFTSRDRLLYSEEVKGVSPEVIKIYNL